MSAGDIQLVGREAELGAIEACLRVGKNVLLEGTVGVGKTYLAMAVAHRMEIPAFRVDGDARYAEQKLTGWFDPPTVIEKGYAPEAFIPGPLTEAMRSGGLLLLNELNRLPEGVQNVLLPAIDEGVIQIPRLGQVRASPGFRVVATQNPYDFVATSHLSEAILDRFELIKLDYQSEEEEVAIVVTHCEQCANSLEQGKLLAWEAVRIARATREDPRIRRGASVRAAISVAEIAAALMTGGRSREEAVAEAARLALPTRIELARDFSDLDQSGAALIDELLADLLAKAREAEQPDEGEKKKPLPRVSGS